MLQLRYLFILFILSGTAQAQLQPKTFPNDPIGVKEYHLKNGLTVYLSENHDEPRVFGAIVVKTGGKKDPSDNTGMAHYLEHMLFKGTEELGTTDYQKEKIHLDEINRLYDLLGKTTDPKERLAIQKKINEESVKAAQYAIPNEMDRMLAEIGGDEVNAFTTEEVTAYYNSFPSNQIRRWLDIYDHRFEHPVFRLFQSELETVYEEKNIGMDDPITYAFEKYMEQFYKVHPYGQQTVIGKTEHLKNPSLTAMYNYYNTYYVANNMALVLSGDFKAEEVIKIIEEKFSDWRSAPVPEFPKYEEKEFKGKEVLKLRATPVKAGLIGFRTPKKNDPDEIAMEVLMNLLSNGSAGPIDRLSTEGKLIEASGFSMVNTDYGASFFMFIPKIVGQPLKKAEKLINAEIEKIQNGNFDAAILEATKTDLIKNFQRGWEQNEQRALTIGTAFYTETDWSKVLNYENEVRAISKEDIIRVAKKYLGENRLVLYSKMGKPKKDKLSKPEFEPVIPKEEKHSAYYEKWKQIPEDQAIPVSVDFNKDIRVSSIGKNITLKQAVNPFNSIFSLKIRFGTGKYYSPALKFAPRYLEYASSENYTAAQFKNELFKLGCSASFMVVEHRFIVYVEGLDENLEKACAIVVKHLTSLKTEDERMKKIAQDLNTELKMSKRSPGFWSGVLSNYVLFGKQSAYLREISLAEFKKMKAAEITAAIQDAMNYEIIVTYVGNLKSESIKNALGDEVWNVADRKANRERVYLERSVPKENTIFLFNQPKALQSQIYFYIEGVPYTNDQLADMLAFNKYFGGDMSSLVFQEIREFRSLAYGTYAQFTAPSKQGEKSFFTGYIGCQGDKTNDAVEAMTDLILNMPQKPERWSSVQSSLIQSAQSERPGFRGIIEIIEYWQMREYKTDPKTDLIAAYEKMNFDVITQFWSNYIKAHPITITIVGNTSKFDMKRLEKFGKVITVKEKEMYKD